MTDNRRLPCSVYLPHFLPTFYHMASFDQYIILMGISLNSLKPGDRYMRQVRGFIIVLGNGIAPVRQQAITWNNTDLLFL